MIALDTNVLARAIVDEADADAATLEQQQAARALLSSGQALFLPVTVIEELEWVLRGVYELPKTDVIAVLEDLLALGNLVVDRAAAVARALEGCRQGMDFSDALRWWGALGLAAGIAPPPIGRTIGQGCHKPNSLRGQPLF
jgi:predicted nucleic-acid-binding protein